MRAPPDADTETSAAAVGRRGLAGTGELLAHDASHRSAHEGEVHHGQPARHRLDPRSAGDQRVAETRRQLRLGQALRIRLQVEEPKRIGGAEVLVGFLDEAGVGKLRDPLRRTHGEVVTALGADAEVERELLVPVVRATPRARVRMALRRRLRLRPLVLDRDVNAVGLGHLRHLRPALREGGYRPTAATRRAMTVVSASGRKPVTPIPASGAGADDSAQHRFDLVDRHPAWLREERGEPPRIEHVDVERNVNGVRVRRRPRHVVVDARLDDDSPARVGRGSARRRGRRPRARRPRVDRRPQCHPPRVARRRRLRGVEVAVRVEPDHRQPLVPHGKAGDRTVWAQQQPPSTRGRSGRDAASARVCSSSVSHATTAASGYGNAEAAASAIASPPAPHARGTNEPRGEGPPRSCGTRTRRRSPRRSACGTRTARAEAWTWTLCRCQTLGQNRPPIVRSHGSLRATTCMPAE